MSGFLMQRTDDSLNGNPLTILTLFADTSRALAVSDDGATVYAAPLFRAMARQPCIAMLCSIGKPSPLASSDGVRALILTDRQVRRLGLARRGEGGPVVRSSSRCLTTPCSPSMPMRQRRH